MPELRAVDMAEINEPDLPMRESMDEDALADLAGSLRNVGLVMPLAVVPRGARYEIVDGHRRFLAARQIGWREISVLVFPDVDTATEALKVAANVFREDVNAAEEGVFYQQLLSRHGFTESELCAFVRQSPYYIGSRLALVRGDPEILQAVRERRISYSVAHELNKVTDCGPNGQRELGPDGEPLPERPETKQMRHYLLDCAKRAGTGSAVVKQWVADWKNQPPQGRVAETANHTPSNGPEPLKFRVECCLCGGHLDPYNLESVFIHKWELEKIRKLIREAAEGEQ